MIGNILKIVLALAALAGGVVVAKRIVETAPEVEPRDALETAPVVRVFPVAREDVKLAVTTYGTVRSRTEIQVVPRVTGRVDYVSPNLRGGRFFKKDEVLVRIEREDYELARTRALALVQQARARLDREQAEAEVAKREWDEFGKGRAPALVLREPQLSEARAAVTSAEASLSAAELDLERTEITAWFDGRVRRESVEVGQFLMAGTNIATVYATDYAEVRLSIPDDQLGYLDLPVLRDNAQSGDDGDLIPVRLSTTISGTEHQWDGVISRSEAEVDPRTRVIHVVARVENPYAIGETGRPPLMIGMYLKAEIPGRTVTDVASVPRAALRGRDQVIVVDAENRLRWRQVQILRKEGTRVLVRSGLEDGERVCMTDLEAPIEGMQVRVEADR